MSKRALTTEQIDAAPPRHAAADEPTARALKLWVVLSRAQRAFEAHAAADAAQHGLTLAEFGALEALYHRGDMLLSDLQRRILVSSGGITFLVDRLTAKGLVRRRDCPEDRRARYASLTLEGERLVREIFPAHAERIRALSGSLSAAEQRELIALLRTLGRAAAELAVEGDAAGDERPAKAPRPRAAARSNGRTPPAPRKRVRQG